MSQPPDPGFVAGLYDKLLSSPEAQALAAAADHLIASQTPVEPEEAHAAVAQYLEKLIFLSLSQYRGKEQAERQRKLIDQLISLIATELGDSNSQVYKLTDPLHRLIAVYKKSDTHPTQPHGRLSRSDIFTGGALKGINLSLELQAEIASADRVDILCSFIKWSGLRLLMDSLKQLTSTPHPDGQPRLRVITTSYMGATDPEAIDQLLELPNAQVKVSYDTKRTRLHAKAYIIRRNTGFGSAYVGSANISHAALSEGLEWTPKISQYELPYLWNKLQGTFDAYWNLDEFEPHTQETKARLRTAINRERPGADTSQPEFFFDLHPYPYQEEILQTLAAERAEQGKSSHLVVAATGTGKTMIAAFDYKRFTADGPRPKLLFIAHRREILEQALATYRAVLRDQNFADLLIGSERTPAQMDHLFCTIQSYNSKAIHALPADHFDYVVVDEFHHAEAPSYKRLLEHVRPRVLLGMTATPERADGLDIYRWFGGRASAQIRLPDAIDRQLLCPFQYFGLSDLADLDLSRLTWKAGGYDPSQLDALYTGNAIRAALILQKLHEITLNPTKTRALAFCVSVRHAQFMADYFNAHGLFALALSAESPEEERKSARRILVERKVNVLCVVDLYNEGVDIPEIDTILLLRPTESLTVYLQQLGRGLRRHDGKGCLTVLDFIGAQHKKFRFASRLRALSADPTINIEKEVEQGFPHLPTGCTMSLERVAQQRVLENIRQSLSLRRLEIVTQLRDLYQHTQKLPTISEALDYLNIELDDLLRRGSWSILLADIGAIERPSNDNATNFTEPLRRLAMIDDPAYIRFLLQWLENPSAAIDPIDQLRLNMLLVTLFPSQADQATAQGAIGQLKQSQSTLCDLAALLQHRLETTHARSHTLDQARSGALSLHANYTRDQILAGLGYWKISSRPAFREGVLHLPERKVDALFITLEKTQESYSATTMYEDYAISETLFHWQSQSTTSEHSPTGQRYIHHQKNGYSPLLFVRAKNKLSTGLAGAYSFLGPAAYVKHEGSRPMSITWRLAHSMPAEIFRRVATSIAS